MPIRVRCKWYHDDGQPFSKDGCRTQGTGCTYVHPSDHDWATAQRRSLASSSRGRGRGRGGFNSPPSRDSGWNASRKSLKTSEWDSEGWKSQPAAPKVPRSSTGSVSSSADHDGGWGAGGNAAAAANASSGSGWGNLDDGKQNTEWGWGATSNLTEPGQSSGWGTGGWDAPMETTGSGAPSGASTSATKDANSGWGTGTWGSGNSANNWGSGEPKMTTTTTTQDSWGTGGGWGQSAPIDRATTQSVPPSRPNDLRVDVEDKMAVDPPLSASSSTYRAGSRGPSITSGTPQSAFPPFAVPGHIPTRPELHSGIVKNSVRVTYIQLELRKLQRQLKAFRVTQLSPQFARISTSGGAHLDNMYGQLKDSCASAQARVNKAEEDLAKYPELPSSAPNTADIDREMMNYTGDLEGWLRSFTRLAVPEFKPRVAPSPSTMNVEPASEAKTLKALIAEIDGRATNLESMLEETADEIDQLYTAERNAECIDNAINAAQKREKSEQSHEAPGAENNPAIAEMQSSADGAHQRLEDYAVQVVCLQEQNESGKKRIKVLEADLAKTRSLNLQMQSQLDLFEQRRKERALQLDMMSAQFARFAKNPNPPPVLDEGVLQRVKANVALIIENEVVPALKGFGTRYTEAIERRGQSLQQSIQPAVDMTSDLCQRAEQIQVDT
ncbi:hypothetical protein C8R46DRAFT_225675 [Mycena filopes]|nr:hypothetical protein C8R46DRAFT_225675 [Mycena filopes]